MYHLPGMLVPAQSRFWYADSESTGAGTILSSTEFADSVMAASVYPRKYRCERSG